MDQVLVFVLVLIFSPVIFSLYEVLNLNCAGTGSDAITYTWNRPSDPSRVVQGYKLNLERTDGLVTDVIPTLDINDYYTENFTFSNLGSYAVYTLSIYTYTTSGNEPTQTVTCRSLTGGLQLDIVTMGLAGVRLLRARAYHMVDALFCEIPYQAPAQVEAVGISYTEIAVNWTEVAEKDRGGILLGYKIVYYKYVSSYKTYINVSNTTTQYTITGLDFDTHYLVGLIAFTSAGDGPVTTDTNKTLGLPTNPPDTVRKYYCYEAIPGMLVFDWDEMPCTVYVGIMGGLLALNLLFLFCCIMACMKKPDQDDDITRDRGDRRDEYPDSESDEDDRPPWVTKGNVTTRDIIIRSPSLSELPPAYDAGYIRPKKLEKEDPMKKKLPVVGKNIIAKNKAKDEDHYQDARARGHIDEKDDDYDSVYNTDESPPASPKYKTKQKVEPLDLSGISTKKIPRSKNGHVNKWITSEASGDSPVMSKFGLRSSGKRKYNDDPEADTNQPKENENVSGQPLTTEKTPVKQEKEKTRTALKKYPINVDIDKKKGHTDQNSSKKEETDSDDNETETDISSYDESSDDSVDESTEEKRIVPNKKIEIHNDLMKPKFSIGPMTNEDRNDNDRDSMKVYSDAKETYSNDNLDKLYLLGMREKNNIQTKVIVVNGKSEIPRSLSKTKSMPEFRRNAQKSDRPSTDSLVPPDNFRSDPTEYVNLYAPSEYDNNYQPNKLPHSAMTRGRYANNDKLRISLSSPDIKTGKDGEKNNPKSRNSRNVKGIPFKRNKVDIFPEFKRPKMGHSEMPEIDEDYNDAYDDKRMNDHNQREQAYNDQPGLNFNKEPLHYSVTSPQEREDILAYNPNKDIDPDLLKSNSIADIGGAQTNKDPQRSQDILRKSKSAAHVREPYQRSLSNPIHSYINPYDDSSPSLRRYSGIPPDGSDFNTKSKKPTMIKPLYNNSPRTRHNSVPLQVSTNQQETSFITTPTNETIKQLPLYNTPRTSDYGNNIPDSYYGIPLTDDPSLDRNTELPFWDKPLYTSNTKDPQSNDPHHYLLNPKTYLPLNNSNPQVNKTKPSVNSHQSTKSNLPGDPATSKQRPPSDYSAPPGMSIESARGRHLPPTPVNKNREDDVDSEKEPKQGLPIMPNLNLNQKNTARSQTDPDRDDDKPKNPNVDELNDPDPGKQQYKPALKGILKKTSNQPDKETTNEKPKSDKEESNEKTKDTKSNETPIPGNGGEIDPDIQVVMKMSQYKKVLGFISKLKKASGK